MKRSLLALAAFGPLALFVFSSPKFEAQVEAQAPTAASAAVPTPTQTEFFEKNVRPVLTENCVSCHGNSASGGLRLDSREAALAGGKSGAAIIPGDPDKSLLMAAVRHTGALKMPLGADKLSDAKVQPLRRTEIQAVEYTDWHGSNKPVTLQTKQK